PLGVAVDEGPGEGKRLEPGLGDVRLAAFAHAVRPALDPGQGVVDGEHLVTIPIGQDQVDLTVTGVAGQVVGVHPLVLGLLPPLVELRLHAAKQLAPHVLEGFARLFEEGLPHVWAPTPSKGRRIYGCGCTVSTVPVGISPSRSYTLAPMTRARTTSPGAAAPRRRITPSIAGAWLLVRPTSR